MKKEETKEMHKHDYYIQARKHLAIEIGARAAWRKIWAVRRACLRVERIANRHGLVVRLGFTADLPRPRYGDVTTPAALLHLIDPNMDTGRGEYYSQIVASVVVTGLGARSDVLIRRAIKAHHAKITDDVYRAAYRRRVDGIVRLPA